MWLGHQSELLLLVLVVSVHVLPLSEGFTHKGNSVFKAFDSGGHFPKMVDSEGKTQLNLAVFGCFLCCVNGSSGSSWKHQLFDVSDSS